MRRRFSCMAACLPLLLPLGGCGRQPDRVTFAGRVVGHDGRPLPSALVLVQGMGVRQRVAVASDGKFTSTLQEPGGYFMWLVGVHHRSLLLPLWIEERGRVEIEARLSAATYVDRIDSVLVIGDFNAFSKRGGRPMTRLGDGTYRLTLATAADTLAYQLLGVQTDGMPLAGTAADHWVCPPGTSLIDGRAGSMISVLRAAGDSVVVTFDPGALPRSGDVETYRFGDPKSRMARFAAHHEDLERRRARRSEAFDRHVASGGDPATFPYDPEPDRAELRARIEAETDPVLRQELLLGYFSVADPGPEDSVLARRALAEIPPTSLVWSLQWDGSSITLPVIARLANQPATAQAYVDSIIAAHPDRTVRAAFLFHETRKAFQAVAGEQRRLSESDARPSGPGAPAASADTSRFALLYDRLVTGYGDTWWGETARKIFPRERNIRPGREVPDFAVASLDDSTVTLTPRSLRGQVYLIDFWAVWCGPCVAEMPYLHAAYEKFRRRGFTILSLSFDKHPLDVKEYRRSTWPMPWLHGFVQDGFDSDLAQRFELMGIPHSVLVDPSGTIRAVDLRGKALEEALAGMFADERVSKPD